MVRSRRHGFTLIELLVVIAIIAILAAILFPVFAQARAAARGASSQSNQKQLSLAILMYVQDYDETYPLFERWGKVGASGYPISFGSAYFTQWGYDIAPYLKNVQVFADPLAPAPTEPSFWWPMFTQYGYNYTVLSPSVGATDANGFWIENPAALASLARPADTVLLAGRMSQQELFPSGPYTVYYYGSGTITSAGGAEAPDCSDIPPYCFSDWAAGSFGLPTYEAGQYTGGVSMRKAQNANLAFCDGHVKFMQAGVAAAGTNWYKGIGGGAVHITTPTAYHWEATP